MMFVLFAVVVASVFVMIVFEDVFDVTRVVTLTLVAFIVDTLPVILLIVSEFVMFDVFNIVVFTVFVLMVPALYILDVLALDTFIVTL
jgi:hypothetical protein